MKQQKSVKLNLIMNAILTMSSFVFPLITFPYVSRVLLPLGTGKVSFATSIVSYFAMIAQLGIPTYGIRACAKVRDNKEKLSKTVHEIFIINMIMCIIGYIAFFITLFLVPRLYEEKLLMLIMSSTLLFNTIGMEWLYRALEQYTYITVRSIIFKFVALIAMFFIVRKQSDYAMYGVVTILAAVGSNIFNFINVHKYISLRPIGHYNLKQHVKPIITFFALSVAATVYTNLDIVMLGFMKTDEDVGYYNAAVRIKSILVSIVTSLGAVLLPRASYYIEQGLMDEFRRISKKAIQFVALLATPLMLYFMLFAKEGIFLLSGDTFVGSIIPMQVIMPTLLFIGMSNILGIQILVPLGKEKIVLYSELAGAAVDLVLNLILIPYLGATGAAIGTLAAELVVWIYQFVVLRDTVTQAYKQIRYLPILLGLVLGSVTSFGIKFLNLSNFFTLVISAILFFGFYGLILTIMKEPMTIEVEQQLLQKLKRKK